MKTVFEQLRRILLEGRPGACVGCQIEKDCNRRGCYALRKVSRVVAEKEEKYHEKHSARSESPD